MISILGEYSYSFPNKLKKEYILKDFLENNVDESYYLSDKMMSCFTDMTNRNGFVRGERFEKDDTKQYKNYVSWKDNKGRINTQDNRAYNKNVIGTIPAMERGVPKILIPEKTIKGYAEAYDGDGVYINRPHQKRGVVQKGAIQTIKTSGNDVGVVVEVIEKPKLRIRKLTPKEAFRLMGVKDRDYDKIADLSDASLYKLAGNSIVIQVLMGIFGELLGIDYKNKIKESVKEIV
jgi:DNA (cytosine-5)-methyltransferase 1